MRNISGILLYLLIISGCTDAAYVVLKTGKKGRIEIHDTTDLYSSKRSYFYAITSKGEFLFEKRTVKYLLIDTDTLFFSGNVPQVVHAVPEVDTLSGVSPANNYFTQTNIAGIADSTIRNVNVTKIKINRNPPALSVMLDSCDRIARRGATMFWLGFGLNYGVAAPASVVSIFKLALNGTIFGDSSDHSGEDGLIFSIVINRAAKVMMIAGAGYCGRGASLAFDNGKPYISGLRKNGNWGFYEAGLITEGVSTALFLTEIFMIPDEKKSGTADFLLGSIFTLGTISNVMFIASTIYSSSYTGQTVSEVKKKTIEVQIHPAVSYKSKSTGLVFNISF